MDASKKISVATGIIVFDFDLFIGVGPSLDHRNTSEETMQLFRTPSCPVNWEFLLADLDCLDAQAKKTSGRVSRRAHSCFGRDGGEFA